MRRAAWLLPWLVLSVACSEAEPLAVEVDAAAGPSLADALPAPPAEQPHIVLVLVDTLRRDHLGVYGYERPTSARLDALGQTGWVFENHVATASQTVPSTLSLLLAQYPSQHGFQHLGPRHFGLNKPRYPDELLFLAEVLGDQGYATGGFVGNPFLQADNGFDQGFDEFVFSKESADQLTDPALAFLAECEAAGRPAFLYLHYFDVHWPYEPPEQWQQRFPLPEGGTKVYKSGPMPGVRQVDLAASVAAYDAGVAWVDSEIGRLLDGVAAAGSGRATLTAVTSDHGDEFLEHGGMGHGTTVYGELIRVPLLLSMPGWLEPGRRIAHLSSQVDLAPTLLALAGLERPAPFDGPLVLQPAARAFTEDGPWRSVHRQGRKLILNQETGRAELYDLADLLDQHPLSEPRSVDSLREDLVQYGKLEALGQAGGVAEAGDDWTSEEIEELRALGYLR